MVEKNGLDTYVSEGDTFNHAEEVPCLDAISPNHSEEVSSLKSCILNRLRRHCAKSLMGPWANSQNVDIEEVGGGLSNYLYVATLKAGTGDVSDMTPTKVFIRVYGELLRSNMNSIILDAVLFALLSEKRLGPKLYGVFPGGRIEEFVESRTLRTEELAYPSVRDCVALHMGALHSLTLPVPKMPTFIFKTMAKFLQQLTGTRQPPMRRLLSSAAAAASSTNATLGVGTASEEENGLPDDVLINNPPPGSLTTSQLFGSTSSIGSIPEPQSHLFKFVSEWRLVEEFEWLRTTFFGNMDRFPVRFCHNDVQENNLLLYKDPSKRGWFRLLTIDYEYGSYNFRCIDIGNFFNEWTYNNRYPHHPGFAYLPEAYPSREDQLAFWRKYLTVYNYVENGGTLPGTYIHQSRRVHSHSVCGLPPMEITKLLRSPPSAPIFKEDHDEVFTMGLGVGGSDGIESTGNSNVEPVWDPALRCLSELEEVRHLEEVTLAPEEEEALLIETTYGALISHLWWTLWALIQSQISSIDFGFIEYAESRMTAYYDLKKTLPASEFPNGEGQCIDLPNSRKANGEIFDMELPAKVQRNGDSSEARPNASNPVTAFYVVEEDG
ncbi:Choline kinase A2 [Echinococcus granulosus]|nr:Choline kinase A2 [Echinococcus granulosus]